jgi:acetate CoA/acetoacetate CoA-transferase alpha subunit
VSPPLLDVASAVQSRVRPGQVVMVGGFGRGGTPFSLLYHLADHPDAFTPLTLVKNDANEPDVGVDLLFRAKMVTNLIATHLGLNPTVRERLDEGEINAELVPQGTLAERIRAAGVGIAAFLSDVGIDSSYAEGKETIEHRGKRYLLEEALHGDVALVGADRVDRAGNCWWRGTNRNFNPLMAMACKQVIVEAKEVVDVGTLAPEDVHLSGVFVDAIVEAGPRRHVAAT